CARPVPGAYHRDDVW
nr:immunoglobulin heavy chain junction region [Macaca mulatta]MOW98631.1 immunoglobulin heavy chain junction region [Macaca mulatta]MOW99722.1 immunoglobulin heavy chain junction region [Macaca mulatta]MOW99803.1 immunoglobulin heavy chain junction region [Macaca mulatta]MOW99813.1 immunoglobulin heavy chain junction region [Macaca mulatta]